MQLKTQTLDGEYEWIRPSDPALGWPRPERYEDPDDPERAAKALEKARADYREAIRIAEETGDYSAVPLEPDAGEPAVWRFRHLTGRQAAWLRDRTGTDWGVNELSFAAVTLALVGVKGFTGPDGQPMEVKRERDPDLRNWVALAPAQAAWIEKHALVVLELGDRVLRELSPPKG